MAKAKREIKTTIAVDGEKEFDKAIKDAGRSMRVMASEMKAAAANFDLTGDEMDFLGKKSEILKRQMAQQADLIRILEDAVADSAKAYGEASAKTDGYRIKLNNAQAAMAKLKKEMEESNREMGDLGRDAGRVGRQLETGLGEAADDTSRKLDSMVNRLDSDLESIRRSVDISAFADVGGMVGGAISDAYEGVTGLVDAAMDYNRAMSFLKINAETAGHDFENIRNYAIMVAGITGDMDAAVEGLSNLLAAGLEADELSEAVNKLSVAVIRFPDTLKFESLADGLQETIATKNAVGQYAEYLERMGIDLDVVNKSLQDAAKSKQSFEAVESAALSWLSDSNADDVLEKWNADNADMVAYFEAQAKLTLAQADLAKELTPIATAAVDGATLLFDTATEAAKEAKALWEAWKKIQDEGGLFRESEKIIEGREENLPTWDEFAPGYDTGAEKEGKTEGEEFIDGVKKGIIDSAPQLPTWDDFAPGYDLGAEMTGKDIAQGLSKGMDDNAYMAENSIKSIMADLQAEANRKPIVIPIRTERQTTTGGQMYAGTQGGSVSVSIGMDGKTFGTTTVPYTDEALGARADRYETYG